MDLYDQITTLAHRAASSYRRLAGDHPQPSSVDLLSLDPAARWVAHGALVGRHLPVNAATLQALTVAVTQLERADRARSTTA